MTWRNHPKVHVRRAAGFEPRPWFSKCDRDGWMRWHATHDIAIAAATTHAWRHHGKWAA